MGKPVSTNVTQALGPSSAVTNVGLKEAPVINTAVQTLSPGSGGGVAPQKAGSLFQDKKKVVAAVVLVLCVGAAIYLSFKK